MFISIVNILFTKKILILTIPQFSLHIFNKLLKDLLDSFIYEIECTSFFNEHIKSYVTKTGNDNEKAQDVFISVLFKIVLRVYELLSVK